MRPVSTEAKASRTEGQARSMARHQGIISVGPGGSGLAFLATQEGKTRRYQVQGLLGLQREFKASFGN